MTVVRLIAAATVKGNPKTRLSSGTRKTPPPNPSSAPRLPATAAPAKMISASAQDGPVTEDGVKSSFIDFELQTSNFWSARYRVAFSIARDSASSLVAPSAAREPRAGVDVGDRAVIDVAELVGFDHHLPARELLLPPRVIHWLHTLLIRENVSSIYGFSTGAPTRLPHSVHEPS